MPGDTFDETTDFEHGECRKDLLGRKSGLGDELVDGDRFVTQVAEQRSFLI